MRKVKITKAFGETEYFQEAKLIRSLKRSGASEDVIANVVKEISANLQEGMSTSEIYRQAFDLLRQYAPHRAAKYKLKQAINELGPTGFPFELYVAELLKAEGHTVKTGVIVLGHCVKHEIDVIAEKEGHRYMVECKFHNAQGIHSDVKIPLYIQSRYLDVVAGAKQRGSEEPAFEQAMVFTNTRFTDDAVSYGSCMGMNLTSWDWPRDTSLRERINATGLHPVTCLTTLTMREKQLLLAEKVVLCKAICENPAILGKIGITNKERMERILSESRLVMKE